MCGGPFTRQALPGISTEDGIMGRKKKEEQGTMDINETQPAAETKAERFARLAQRRMTDALQRIGRVRKLSAKSNYEYTPEQAGKILLALLDAVKAVELAFSGNKDQASGFTF